MGEHACVLNYELTRGSPVGFIKCPNSFKLRLAITFSSEESTLETTVRAPRQ
jgi:hypothetical protein